MSNDRINELPRRRDGKFLPRHCPDPNCSGETVLETRQTPWRGKDRVWRCDGLTHLTDDGPLIACEREHDAALSKARAQ
jgi:hypothetical protein